MNRDKLILNHSGSVFLFAADGLFEKLEVAKMPAISGIVSLTKPPTPS